MFNDSDTQGKKEDRDCTFATFSSVHFQETGGTHHHGAEI